MKKTWQGIKQIININNKAGPQINTNEVTTFNEFFTEIGPQHR